MMARILLLALSASVVGMTAGFTSAPSMPVSNLRCLSAPSFGQHPRPSLRTNALQRGSSFTGASAPAQLASGFASSRKERSQQLNPHMVIGVLGALTAPIVVFAAMGTLDGFGKVVLNLPKILEYQMRYATRLLQQGSGAVVSNDPLDVFRSKLDESDEYRYNALKLFVKYDSNGDGRIDESEMTLCLTTEPLFQTGLPEDFSTKVVSVMSKGQGIGPQEFLTVVRGQQTSPDDAQKMLTDAREAQVVAAYEECRELTSEYAKTFFLATLAMEAPKAKATWAIYAWCRRVDEIVDGPDVDPDPAVQRAALEEWNSRLERMYKGEADNRGLENFDIAFRNMIQQFPGSDIEPYRDMVRGMVMDIDQDVYQTWDDLYLYCYRVASTVGLMTLPVMGTAPGVTMEQAKDPAVALGIGLQITNILRDVGEDARDRGRIYLPQEDLRKFGVTPESILERAKNGGAPDENYKNLMKFQIARARDYYRQAEAGIALLSPGAQLPVAVAAELYKGILDKIESNDYDNFNTRAYLSREQKMMAVPPLWFKTVTGGWDEVRRNS